MEDTEGVDILGEESCLYPQPHSEKVHRAAASLVRGGFFLITPLGMTESHPHAVCI